MVIGYLRARPVPVLFWVRLVVFSCIWCDFHWFFYRLPVPDVSNVWFCVISALIFVKV